MKYAYPFRVRGYSYRDGSGGAGQYRGGDGLIREIEMLTDAKITLLADRRKLKPYKLQGGAEGTSGRACLILPDGGQEVELPGKCSLSASAESILRLETPGGGGWGRSDLGAVNEE